MNVNARISFEKSYYSRVRSNSETLIRLLTGGRTQNKQ